MAEKQYKKGDTVRVKRHTISSCGVEQVVEAYAAKFVEECSTYYIVYNFGYRYIPKDCLESTEAVIVGNKVRIKCSDCDDTRLVPKSSASRVKRCKKCQRIFNKKETKVRMQKLRAGNNEDNT